MKKFFSIFLFSVALLGFGCKQELPPKSAPTTPPPELQIPEVTPMPTEDNSKILPEVQAATVKEIELVAEKKPVLPARVALPVPFTSQAPFGNWSNPWGTACEKAAAFMIDAFFKNQKTITKEEARDNILLLEEWENFQIGTRIETTIAETANMINAFFPWEVTEVENPTLEDLKKELLAGRPVIVPAAGKILKNPNFRNGGPDYHVFVLSGYDDATKMFIAQEPGTRNGRDYKYPYATVMSAIHDMVPNKQTITGRKVVLFTHTDIRDTGDTDGDADGVTKVEEIKRGTSLMDNGTGILPEPKPEPTDKDKIEAKVTNEPSTPSALSEPTKPTSVSLNVPFSSQAPFGDWSEPWGSACEEASAIMIDTYYHNKTTLSKVTARDSILALVALENKYLGYNKDTNADETAKMINAFFPWEVAVVANPTLDDLKAELKAGRPIIIPAAGKMLKNPNFRNGGPDYHILLLSGYDDVAKTFIAQDPGTSRGLDYRYSYDTIMGAIHDQVLGGKTSTGRKVVLFTHQDIRTSGDTDGDGDGLTKAQELEKGTSLFEKN